MAPPQAPIPFFKMTGSGNDFIVIDNRDQRIDADRAHDLVRRACRRKLSVGADGLILIENDGEVDFRWRFFNSDGSEAEMCGNGARCAVRFAHLHGIINHGRAAFRTIAGIIRAEVFGERVKFQVTPPEGLERGLSVEAEGTMFALDFINTGVPHVVWFAQDRTELEQLDVFRWGRALRHHDRFQPAGTNVNFAWAAGPGTLINRTYERGVEAETLACGTGAVAAALLAAGDGRVTPPVEVITRSGGVLTIHFEQNEPFHFREVFLEGDAQVVYRAELWDETLK